MLTPKEAKKPRDNTAVNLYVSEYINNINLREKNITFPASKPPGRLNSQAYLLFLQKMSEKLGENTLEKLTIALNKPGELTSFFKGLSQFKKPELPFQLLCLKSSSEANLRDLAQVLMQSNRPLSILIDAPISLENIDKLIQLIQENQLCVHLRLPHPHQHSKSQEALDNLYADIDRARRIKALRQETVAPIALDIQQFPTRKRQKIAHKAEISIEMQQEADSQQQQQAENNDEVNDADEIESTIGEFYNLNTFQNLLHPDNNPFSPFYSEHELEQRKNYTMLWCNWFGNHPEEQDKPQLCISKAALTQLLQYHKKFRFGLDLYRLPAGLLFIQKDGKKILHFSDHVKQMAPTDPLTVQWTLPEQSHPLSPILFRQWYESPTQSRVDNCLKMHWENILKSAEYDRTSQELFRQMLPELRTLALNDINTIFQQAFHHGKLDPVLFKKAFSYAKAHGGQSNPGALMQLFCQSKVFHELCQLTALPADAFLQLFDFYGEAGLLKFKQLIQEFPDIFSLLSRTLLPRSQTLLPFLSKEYLAAIKDLQALPKEQLAFFDLLLKQHCKHQGASRLPELVNAFMAYCKEMQELTNIHGPFELNIKGFQDVKSLPVTLSRVITLLKNCSPASLKKQAECIAHLDLSSMGAIKALRGVRNSFDQPWLFFSPEMGLSFITFPFKRPGSWKTVANGTTLPGAATEQYLRFVANQEKNNLLSMEFYTRGLACITSSSLTQDVKNWTLTLMAGATTGDSINFVKNEQEAIQNMEKMVKLLENPPTPLGINMGKNDTQKIRLATLDFFLKLISPFPLVLMNRVLTMFTTLMSSGKMIWYGPQIPTAIERINAGIDTFASAVYQGLKDYDDKYYAENTYFLFAYFETVDYIGKLPLDFNTRKLLITLISTFHLDKSRAKKLGVACNNDIELLEIFAHASTLGLSYLKIDQCLAFLPHLKTLRSHEEKTQFILGKIQNDKVLSLYFKKEFLENYGKKAIPSMAMHILNDTKFLDETQKDLLKKILLKFEAPKDYQQYQALVEKIIALAKCIDTDKLSLLLTLLNDEQICKSSPLGSDQDYFNKNLNFILRYKSPDSFIYCLGNGNNKLNNKENLLFSAYQYQVEMLPKIAKINPKHYSESMLLPLLWNVITQADNAEFSHAFNTDKAAYKRLHNVQICWVKSSNYHADIEDLKLDYMRDPENALQQRRINFSAIQEAMQTLLHYEMAIEETHSLDFLKNTQADFLALETRQNNPEIQDKTIDLLIPLLGNKNSDLRIVLAFLNDEPMDPQQKKQVKEQLEKHPLLIQKIHGKQQYFDILTLNPCFQDALLQDDTLANCRDNKILNNETNMGNFLEALNADLDRVQTYFNTIDTLKNHTKNIATYQSSWKFTCLQLFQKIHEIGGQYPGSKTEILELIQNLITQHDAKQNPDLLLNLQEFVAFLEKNLSWIQDKKTIFSLCFYFRNTDNINELLKGLPYLANEEEREIFAKKLHHQIEIIAQKHHVNPTEVVMFIDNFIKTKNPESANEIWDLAISLEKKYTPASGSMASHPMVNLFTIVNRIRDIPLKNRLLKIASVSMNEHKNFSLLDFDTLVGWILEQNSLSVFLEKAYKQPPYPQISQIILWLRTWVDLRSQGNTISLLTYLDKQYADFKPYERDTVNNGFDLEKAKKIILSRAFVNSGLDADMLEKFDALLKSIADWPVEDLLLHFHSTKNNMFLIVHAAELLFQSKGWELNTHQYLAILSIVLKGKHVSAGIGTGEGKTRISLVLLACQSAMGNTVDFITADVALAKRDFLNAQVYFELLGIDSSIIDAACAPESYLKNGINFSDPANMNLFRNRSQTLGKGALVKDVQAKRAAVLDEADVFLFGSNTRFNYSTTANQNIANITWIYDLLMDFFHPSQSEHPKIMKSYYEDIDGCIQRFRQFARIRCTEQQIKHLDNITDAQIEQWHDSAIDAYHLEYDKGFLIVTQLINTPQGPVYSSLAKVLDDNHRIATHAQFSFGVQQCLHARLNYLRKHPKECLALDPNLRKSMQINMHPFHISDEKLIVFSTISKNFLDDYAQGLLYCISGTPGSAGERAEALTYYGLEPIIVPRAKPVKRKATNYQRCDNKQGHYTAIYDHLLMALKLQQPVLLVCDSDKKSQEVMQWVSSKMPPETQIQRIHAGLTLQEETKAIERAGQPGLITVATDMVGRGVDISLQGQAVKHGLCVMLLYVPEWRDEIQIVSRAGRFGQEGSAFVIVNLQEYQQLRQLQQDQTTVYVGDIKFIQQTIDLKNQRERLIKNLVGDFRYALQTAFFTMLHKADQPCQAILMDKWAQFISNNDKTWNSIWPAIQAVIPVTNKAEHLAQALIQINQLLTLYQDKTDNLWKEMISQSRDADIPAVTLNNLPINLPPLAFNGQYPDSKTAILFSFLQDKNKYGLFAIKDKDFLIFKKDLEILLTKAEPDIDNYAEEIILLYLADIFDNNQTINNSASYVNYNLLCILDSMNWNHQWFERNDKLDFQAGPQLAADLLKQCEQGFVMVNQ
jgi:hypothetical protein